MQTTWIVAADSSRARIFEVHGIHDPLREIEDFENPAGRLQDHELGSDARGHTSAKGGHEQAHAPQPRVDEVEHQTQLFSKRVSEYLDQARIEHRYDKLCLIAFPKFLGLMRRDLSKDTQQLVEDEVPKDISKLEARDIEEYVRNRLH
jgi:protein required for attachment to host cells